MKMIQVTGLTKTFGGEDVLLGVDLTVHKGETIAVIGPSGGGKSTMLRCLMHLESADSGTILIEGEPLVKDGIMVSDKKARVLLAKIGMVFQSFNLFPHLTVLGNLICAPVHVRGDNEAEAIGQARELLQLVGLSDKAEARPGELSGGQKQRVAIARALMMRPDVLLFDEPTSSLDPLLTGEVLAVMRGLTRRRMTMVVVTHEMAFAREAADRVLFMGGGRILEEGSPDVLFGAPRNPQVRAFVESIL